MRKYRRRNNIVLSHVSIKYWEFFTQLIMIKACLNIRYKVNIRNKIYKWFGNLLSIFGWVCFPGLSLAMSRDGSSGGVVRLASINKDGVERFVLTGDQIPKFYEEYWWIMTTSLFSEKEDIALIFLSHHFIVFLINKM